MKDRDQNEEERDGWTARDLVERVGRAEDRAEAAIQEMLEDLMRHRPEPAAKAIEDVATRPADPDELAKKVVSAVAATSAAVNVVVLPGAHDRADEDVVLERAQRGGSFYA